MTAEIAVLNRVGVALAADSAVTIGPRGDKIWTSADKLFQLSEVDPIGVMIYGNAEFVGIPLELPLQNRTLQLARLISLYSMGDSIFKPLWGRTRL